MKSLKHARMAMFFIGLCLITSPPANAAASSKSALEKSIKHFIQLGFNADILSKINNQVDPAEIWVRPNWQAIDFELKQRTAKAICSLYCQENPLRTWATIKDAMTGKDIGYLDSTGLHLQ